MHEGADRPTALVGCACIVFCPRALPSASQPVSILTHAVQLSLCLQGACCSGQCSLQPFPIFWIFWQQTISAGPAGRGATLMPR